MRGGSPGLEPMYPSETRFDPPSAFRSTEYGSDEASQKGKKRKAGRRADSVEMDDDSNPRKSRNPRKTAVACNFCRGKPLLYEKTKLTNFGYNRAKTSLQRCKTFVLQLHCKEIRMRVCTNTKASGSWEGAQRKPVKESEHFWASIS